MAKSSTERVRKHRAKEARQLAKLNETKAVTLTKSTEPLPADVPERLPSTWEEVYEVIAASSPGILEGQDKIAVVVGAKVLLRALEPDCPATIVAEARGFLREFGLTPASRGSIARDMADAQAKARSWTAVP